MEFNPLLRWRSLSVERLQGLVAFAHKHFSLIGMPNWNVEQVLTALQGI